MLMSTSSDKCNDYQAPSSLSQSHKFYISVPGVLRNYGRNKTSYCVYSSQKWSIIKSLSLYRRINCVIEKKATNAQIAHMQIVLIREVYSAMLKNRP